MKREGAQLFRLESETRTARHGGSREAMTAPPVSVAPIRDEDLDSVCVFLREKFRSPCDHATWRSTFTQPWSKEKPNNGFMLRAGGEIVGVLGAIYSDQIVADRIEPFCNLTSWYIVEEHRSRGLLLLMQLIGQDGYTFTNLSASPTVEEILLRFGFKALSKDIYFVANLAFPLASSLSEVDVVTESDAIARVLDPERARICLDHRNSRVHQLAIGTPTDGYCHVLFSRCSCRRLPCAIVHDVGSPTLLVRFWTHFVRHLLYRTGALATRIEARLLDGEKLPFSLRLTNRSGALFLSRRVPEEAISRRYTEAMNLTGC